MSSYRECPRRWGFKYIAKKQEPSTPAQELGNETEAQINRYLNEGIQFDFTRESGHIAASALAFLPKPQTEGLSTQKHVVIPSPTWINGEHVGFGFQGFLDLWLPYSSLVPDIAPPEGYGGPGLPFVGDFKTTSDLKWRKREDRLLVDVQAMVYAFAILYETRAPAVDLAWIYMQTRGARKAQRTRLRVLPDHAAEQFEGINRTALEMHACRAAAPEGPSAAADAYVLALEPNPDACESYGGCPHRATCNLSPAQIVTALEARAAREKEMDGREKPPGEGASLDMTTASQDTGTLLASLRARKAATGAPVPPPSVVPEAPTAAAVRAEYGPGAADDIEGATVTTNALGSIGINPPEAALPPADPIGTAPAVEIKTPAPKTRKRVAPKAEETPEVSAAAAEPTPSVAITLQPFKEVETESRFAAAVAAAAKAFLAAYEGGR